MNDDIPIEITEAAAQWLDILVQDEVSMQHRELFVRWLNQSPVHVAEFLSVSALHAGLSEVLADIPAWATDLLSDKGTQVISISDSSRGEIESNMQQASDPAAIVARQSQVSELRFWNSWVALAATVVISMGVLLFAVSYSDPSRLTTEIGEQRIVVLEDGSRLELNTNSEVYVRYSDSVRELELVRGELLIGVRKDPARPFIVRTDQAIVKALGTQFNVYRRKNTTEISVVEGLIEVDWFTPSRVKRGASTHELEPIRLIAGQGAVVAEDSTEPQPSLVDTERATAWTKQRLSFNDATVASVAAEFNRYNRNQLIVRDPELAKRRISGIFDVNDPSAFIALLGGADVIEVEIGDTGNRKLPAQK